MQPEHRELYHESRSRGKLHQLLVAGCHPANGGKGQRVQASRVLCR